MKKNMKSSSILLGGLFLLGAVCSCTQTAPDYASYVNPFIGTGGHGHTYPGAVVPNDDSAQPRHAYLRVGCLLRILLCRYYYQRIFTYPRQRYGLCRLRGCAADAHCRSQDYHSMGSKSQQMAYASAFPTRMKQPNRDIIPYFWTATG